MKLNPKMGFLRAKHGLSKHELERPKLVSNLGRAQKRMGEGEEKRKRKKKKRRRKEEKEEIKQKGMETTLSMELWIFVWKLTLVMNSMRFGMEL